MIVSYLRTQAAAGPLDPTPGAAGCGHGLRVRSPSTGPVCRRFALHLQRLHRLLPAPASAQQPRARPSCPGRGRGGGRRQGRQHPYRSRGRRKGRKDSQRCLRVGDSISGFVDAHNICMYTTITYIGTGTCYYNFIGRLYHIDKYDWKHLLSIGGPERPPAWRSRSNVHTATSVSRST